MNCTLDFVKERSVKRHSAIMFLFLAFGIHAAVTKIERPPTVDPGSINNPALTEVVGPRSRGSAVVRGQILLDRAQFSSGEIDGYYGANLRKAVIAYQKAHGLRPNGLIDLPTWTALNADLGPALTTYTIAPTDVVGPFFQIPQDMVEKSKIPVMTYESSMEGMSETFHINPQ